jgi:hypothetical protein
MKRCTSFVAALLIIAASVSTARAVIHFEDTFDTYADQAAYQASWTPMGCTGQGASCTGNVSTLSQTLSTDTSVSLPNAILNHSPVGSPGTSDSSQRNFKNISVTPTLAIGDQLIWSFDFYDISPAIAPYRQHANMQTSSSVATNPAGQLVSMGLNNSQGATTSGGQYYMARILGYSNPVVDPDGGPNEEGAAETFIKLNDFDPTPLDNIADGPGARSEGWHNLKVNISTPNGTDTNYNFYVDNVLAEHILVTGSSPRTYSHLRMGAGVSSTEDAYYDNYKIEFIPAPVTNDADFNEDGVIDAGDYPSWRKFNPTATGATEAMGDADGDGDVDAADEAKWEMTFGNSSPTGSGGSGAVPEPSSIVMLLLAVAGLASRRRG